MLKQCKEVAWASMRISRGLTCLSILSPTILKVGTAGVLGSSAVKPSSRNIESASEDDVVNVVSGENEGASGLHVSGSELSSEELDVLSGASVVQIGASVVSSIWSEIKYIARVSTTGTHWFLYVVNL